MKSVLKKYALFVFVFVGMSATSCLGAMSDEGAQATAKHSQLDSKSLNRRLLLACLRNDESAAVQALDDGAHWNAQNEDGKGLLHRAAKHGHVSLCTLLLTRKADIELRDNNQETPLYAAVNGWMNARCDEVVLLLLQKHADIHAKNKHGQTPLHDAVMKGDKRVVELLLQYGANAQEKDAYGRTPCQFAQSVGKKELLILLEKKEEKGSCILL